jgi:uncharacterized coiled-coil DUF342 family protein
MALKDVINKSVEVKQVADEIDELVAKKDTLQKQVTTLTASIVEKRTTRDALVTELKALVAALP